MNTQERQQLTSLLQRLCDVQVQQKDLEAESLVREACARQPDVAYLLAQRALGREVQPACFDCAPPEGGYAFEAAGAPLAH